MKKVLSFLFAVMMLVVVSCNNSTNDTAAQTDTTVCDTCQNAECTCTDTIVEGVDAPVEVSAEVPITE